MKETIDNLTALVSKQLEPTMGVIFWHLDVNWQDGNPAYLLGYNESNEFVELSIYDEDNYEVRYYGVDGWTIDTDLSKSTDD